MRNLILILALACTIQLTVSAAGNAQFRSQEHTPYTSTGKVVKKDYNTPGKLAVQMSHNYSMMFSSFGNEMQNINMYTNSLDFYFSEKLTGDLDISFMHSPFGASMLDGANQSPFNGQVFINNAQLNYQISKRATISVQFQQHPYGYGFNRYGHHGINNFFLN